MASHSPGTTADRAGPPGLLAFLAWLDPKEALGLPFVLLIVALLARRGPSAGDGSGGLALAGFLVVGAVWATGIALTAVRPARRWMRSAPRRAELVRFARDLAAVCLCFCVYGSLQWAVPAVNPRVYDPQLAALDRWLFAGAEPALLFDRLVTPGLTLLFSLLYFLHFPLFFVTPLLLFLQRRERERSDLWLALLLAMYLGMVGYFSIPAYGPLYGLADRFSSHLGNNALRDIVHSYGVALGTFPSLHGGVALVVLVFAWRDSRRLFWLLLPLALGIWVSTVYLRYHYVVDLLAGWALALACCWLAPRLNRTRQRWLSSRHAQQTRVRLARRAVSLLPGRSGA